MNPLRLVPLGARLAAAFAVLAAALLVVDGGLRDEDLISWPIEQGAAQMLGELA